MAQQPDPLAQQIINSRPQIPGQLVGNMPLPGDRAAAIALMPAATKLQVAELVIGRMAKAYGLSIDIKRSGDGLDIRIDPPR